MNAAVKTRWVAALRSGEYKQTTGALHRTVPLGSDAPAGFCCLGVLCDLAEKDGVVHSRPNDTGTVGYDGAGESGFYQSATLPGAVVNWAGLGDDNPLVRFDDDAVSLSELNDELGAGFTEIADVIEECL